VKGSAKSKRGCPIEPIDASPHKTHPEGVTFAEATELVASVRFTGMYRSTVAKLRALPGGGAQLTLTVQTWDRDTGALVPLSNALMVDGFNLEHMRRMAFLSYVRHCFRDLVLHEADEAIVVGGMRLYDPHRYDREPEEVAPTSAFD